MSSQPHQQHRLRNKAANWLIVSKPALYGDVLGTHLPWAFFSGVVLIIATIWPLAWIPHIPCYFLKITGWPCPFCGTTRACLAMGHGHWAEALYQSPAGVLFFLFVAVIFLWNASALLTGRKIALGTKLDFLGRKKKILILSLIALWTINWVYRLTSGLK